MTRRSISPAFGKSWATLWHGNKNPIGVAGAVRHMRSHGVGRHTEILSIEVARVGVRMHGYDIGRQAFDVGCDKLIFWESIRVLEWRGIGMIDERLRLNMFVVKSIRHRTE